MKKNLFLIVLSLITLSAVALTRKPIYTSGSTPIYIETSRCVTASDGTVTNTFGITYSAAPKVIVSGFGTALAPTNFVKSVTTSNCVINCGASISGITNDLIIIGVP